MTPLERAARALYRSAPHDFDPNQMGEDATWPDLIEHVRAVLTAIREPSEAMISESHTTQGEHWFATEEYAAEYVREDWARMIDAALNEQ